MGKYAVVVIGPAGSGKSTLCAALADHYATLGRATHLCNLDPAAEDLRYPPSVDVRDLIALSDAMEAHGLGPNGGLVYCMEYLLEHQAWLCDQLGDYAEDFILVDMPGQVEVLSHIPAVPALVEILQREGYRVVVLFLLDALAATADTGKFVSGCMFSLSSMVMMPCPYLNVLTKCDLLADEFRRDELEHFCQCDFDHMNVRHLPKRWRAMVREICTILHDFSLVTFRPMDVADVTYITNLGMLIDETLQVADEAEVQDREVPLGGGEDGSAPWGDHP